MGSWHVHHIYRLAILVMLLPPIPLIVSKAIFDADNDPNRHRQMSALKHVTEEWGISKHVKSYVPQVCEDHTKS